MEGRRKRAVSKYRLQIRLSNDGIKILDDMRTQNGSMTRSAMIEMAIRRYYLSDEMIKMREYNKEESCQNQKRKKLVRARP